MKRKSFLKKGLAGLSAMVGIPAAIVGYNRSNGSIDVECDISPRETAGPFPIKSPADLVRENIISDRKGIPLLMNILVQDKNKDCKALAGVFVDVWLCDSKGYYSEYGGMRMQREDMTGYHFLRGRQTTDTHGQVSFVSIYPGWYPGRAPHIHVEVLDKNQQSLLVTQIAFPDEISEEVYATDHYKGSADTTNIRDGIFRNSLEGNLGSVSGNTTDGYTLTHTIIVES